jgi:hypothetical protein
MNLFVFSARKAMSLPARSCRMKVAPPEVPTPWMAGRREGEADGPAEPAELLREFGLDGAVLLLGLLALGPVLEA